MPSEAGAASAPLSAPLGIILLSDSHDRAHFAFLLASGAAALGRTVVLFATNRGCIALMAGADRLQGVEREARIESRGVAGLATLRDACLELGVRLIACEAGLRAEALDQASLLPAVEVAGVATFLSAVGPGQIVSI